MYAIIETQTNENGIMNIVEPIFKTPNPVYAQNKIFTIAASAVASSDYVHTNLCINEHGQPQFGTPMTFEHIEKGDA